MIKVIKNDPTRVRGHVKAMLQAKQYKDRKALAEQVKGYSEILPEHIKKEDEILFPWIDRILSTKRVGQLYLKFNEIDEEYWDAREKF